MPNNILITPGSASIQFSGSAANTIRLQVESSGSIAFYGNSGSLFGITDSLSGSLMSVNDISGLPILEVFSDDRIVMGTFNKNTLVVTGSRIGIDKAVPTTDLDISGSVFITGSLTMNSGGITGSLFGTSSWASNAISSSFATTASAATSITFTPATASFATSASYALSASYAPSAPGGGITSITVSDGLSGGVITTTGTISLDTGSAHFLDGVKKELNTEGVVSSSSQINTGSFSGSITTASFATSASFAVSASYAPGGGGSGNGFPFSGSAIITGSLLVSSSVANVVTVQGSVDDFFEIEINNKNAGNAASSDVVASADDGTDFGNYINMGINSTTYNAGFVGAASDGYLYLTSSVGELHIGNASTGATSNIRLFTAGIDSDANTRIFISASGNVGIGVSSNVQNRLHVQGNVSASSYTSSISNGVGFFGTASFATTASLATALSSGVIITGSLTSGSVTNITEFSMLVSGTIPANGTTSVTLNLNTANYFTVSGSGTGTVTWAVTNAPPTGRAQTFVIEYTNGGIKTNNWFTNTRWPAGIAPSLTSASANPDMLSFTTDDAGSNWRGLLLQRGSA